MYVCLCKGINDRQVKSAIDEGHSTLGGLRKNLGVATQCGKCTCLVKELLSASNRIESETESTSAFYAVT